MATVTQHPLVAKTYGRIGDLGNQAAKHIGYISRSSDLDAINYQVAATCINQMFHLEDPAASKSVLDQVEAEYPHDFTRFHRMGQEIAKFVYNLCKQYPNSPLAQQLQQARLS